jgi:beta-glucosidase/6-phospho-beta-glucosidase/beta-galactosidase
VLVATCPADINATDVYMQFQVGWIADPLYFGDYPAVMRASQPHLPKFRQAEKKLLAGSVDFFALNYFTSHYVAAASAGAPKSQVGQQVGFCSMINNNLLPSALYW